MLQGETIMTGAPQTCPDCKVTPEIEVCFSGGGHYLGTMCDCGPWSRESGYFKSRDLADEALARFKSGNLQDART